MRNRWMLIAVGLTMPVFAGEDEENAKVRAAHRERMKAIAGRIHVFSKADRRDSEVALVSEPVLRYTDPTRKLHESGLWIWGRGRPAAIVAIEFYPQSPKGPRWLYEIASLSSEKISARGGGDLDWTAEKPGLNLQELPEAPAPADRPAGRLVQLRELQRRFRAHEVAAIGGRIELRPLAKPLHRYEDAAAGVIDGAILSFANGTNPEVLLIVEARSPAGASPRWEYSLAQMTGAEVSAELDGRQVWTAGEADPPSVRDSYVNGWFAPIAE